MIVSCPTCHQQVIWDNTQKFRPFCSERCQLIDLGEWASEQKRIPGEAVETDPYPEDNFFKNT